VLLCMLLCILEAVQVEICSWEMLEVISCMLLCMLEALKGRICLREVLEVMFFALNTEGCGEWTQFRGFKISDVAVFSLQSVTARESRFCNQLYSQSRNYTVACRISVQ
jgi:hypothetical protein